MTTIYVPLAHAFSGMTAVVEGHLKPTRIKDVELFLDDHGRVIERLYRLDKNEAGWGFLELSIDPANGGRIRETRLMWKSGNAPKIVSIDPLLPIGSTMRYGDRTFSTVGSSGGACIVIGEGNLIRSAPASRWVTMTCIERSTTILLVYADWGEGPVAYSGKLLLESDASIGLEWATEESGE
jgi:hypothetical protein